MTNLFNYYKQQIKQINRDLSGSELFWKRSAGGLALYYPLKSAIAKYVKGSVLDVGAGFMPYKKFINKKASSYWSTDFAKTHDGITYVGDAQSLSKTVKGKRFDTIFCTEVLEHLPDPFQAVAEFHKTLNDGGTIILSVPFVMPLHNEPYDFYRYTKYGLLKLFEKFEVMELTPSGGLLSLLHYLVSSSLLPLTYPTRPLFYLLAYINWPIGELCYRLDNLLFRKMMPFKYIIVCKK